MVIEFAATGALAKAERDIAERADARRKLDTWSQDLRAVGPRHYVGGIPSGGAVSVDALADIAWLVPGKTDDD